MTLLWRSLVTFVLLHESLSRKFSPGPTVDPGVFVITHISSCRNGAGYCMLGFTCSVDIDFVGDDLGGHCDGLSESFGDRASFVCCRENPEHHPPAEIPELPALTTEATTTTTTAASTSLVTSTSVVTEVVTEIVTEVIPVTEMVTEILHPGIVIEDTKNAQFRREDSPHVNCFAAILLGIKCNFDDIDKDAAFAEKRNNEHKAQPTNFVLSSSKNVEAPQYSVELPAELLVEVISEGLKNAEIKEEISYQDSEEEEFTTEHTQHMTTDFELLAETSTEANDNEDSLATSQPNEDEAEESTTAETTPFSTQGLISTLVDLEPDRDDTFQASVLSAQSSSQVSATAGSQQITESQPELRISAELRSDPAQCGRLGGAAVLQAFGRAAHNLLPDLVFSWVTGGQGTKKSPSARLDDSEEDLEPRIIAGDVTSTVLYCWMAAIMEVAKDGDEPDQFICTGTLVQPDLVVTSASCTLRMFETGVHNFHVVVGDSNLKIDLPFGVQIHEISQVIVHENYRPDDSFHYEDIGLIKLKTFAKMETTVCLLCLPEEFSDYESENCTVVGYGRPSALALNAFERENNEVDFTDGILRKADLPIVDTIMCQEYLDVNARSDDMHSGFICAGGKGNEESCYIAMDGGSPLACKKDKDHYELAGLVTFGTSCSHDQSPSLFTNVSKHYKWIMENYKTMNKK